MTRGPHLTLDERRGPSCFQFTFWIGFRSESNDCHLLTLLPPPVPSLRTPPLQEPFPKLSKSATNRGLAQPPVRHCADHTHGLICDAASSTRIRRRASVRHLLIPLQILRGESIPDHNPAPVDLTFLGATFITAPASQCWFPRLYPQ